MCQIRVLYRAVKTPIVLTALIPMLFGCGGGNSGPGGLDLPTQQNVNGSAQGWIWHTGEGYRLDVSSGQRVELSENLVYPRADGREYAEVIPEYKNYSGESCSGLYFATTSGIHIRDTLSGDSLNFMEMRLRISSTVLISPDGQTLAAWAKPYDECAEPDDAFVVTFNRSGEIISTGSSRVRGFDWMPDNRLAFISLDGNTYKLAIQGETNAAFNGTVTATLPDLGGSPTRFRISPDGTQVLFEVVTGGPVALTSFSFREATIWVMNIDGSNLRQLASTSRQPTITNEEPRVNQPVWSPDSQNVLMTENYKRGFSIVTGTDAGSLSLESWELANVNYEYLTYIVPANSDLTLLPPASVSPNGVRPLFWNDEGQKQPLQMDPMRRHVWTPRVQ